jgi:hypothetical protein
MHRLFQVGSQLHHLKFDWRHEYKNSLGLPVSLRLGKRVIDFLAKIDTGAEFCIFERAYGEQLGLTIEDGYQQWLAVAREEGSEPLATQSRLSSSGVPSRASFSSPRTRVSGGTCWDAMASSINAGSPSSTMISFYT